MISGTLTFFLSDDVETNKTLDIENKLEGSNDDDDNEDLDEDDNEEANNDEEDGA